MAKFIRLTNEATREQHLVNADLVTIVRPDGGGSRLFFTADDSTTFKASETLETIAAKLLEA